MGSHGWRWLGSLRTPLRARWPVHTRSLIGLRMHILRKRCSMRLLGTGTLTAAQQRQSRFDVLVGGVQLRSALIGI
jgi:hypothetical protein